MEKGNTNAYFGFCCVFLLCSLRLRIVEERVHRINLVFTKFALFGVVTILQTLSIGLKRIAASVCKYTAVEARVENGF